MYDSKRKGHTPDNELNQGTDRKRRKSSQTRRGSKSSESDEQNGGVTGVPRRRSARIAKRNGVKPAADCPDTQDTIGKEKVDYKGVPEHLRKFKWLYVDNALTDKGRIKIIKFLNGRYTRNDVEQEDILLTRAQVKKEGKSQIEESVFRMFFDTKRWRRVSVRRIL